MNGSLTHVRRREIEQQIRELASEGNLHVQILSPLNTAQSHASQVWRSAIELRSSLRAAGQEELAHHADLLIVGSLGLLDDIERTLYPGENFEMQEVEHPEHQGS